MPLAKISRRTVLRGAGGVVIALPPLEAMMNGNGTAYADGKPSARYVVCYGGCSIGSSYDKSPPLFAPDTKGPGYDLKMALQPIAPIKDLVSVVSGLRIPCAAGVEEGDLAKIPPGGKPGRHHNYGLYPLLSGERQSAPDYGQWRGPTSDQVIDEAMPKGSSPYQSLQYAIQASNYYHIDASITNISVGSDRNPVPAQDKPSQAWRKLFLNFTPPPADGQAAAKQFELLRAERKSVLDAVVAEGRIKRLLSRVSAADRGTIELHLQKVRGLQDQIAKAAVPNTAACQKVAGPPADPPIGQQWKINSDDSFATTETGNYSNEEERAKLFMQFSRFALACNQTRVLSVKFTEYQSYMNMYPLIGDKIGRVTDLHGCGHGDNGFGKQTEAAAAIAWHMGHFTNLVSGLRDTAEGSGTVLDNTVLVFVFDSGWGVPEEADNQGNGPGPHCSQNMGALVAGGKNLGLKLGRHIPFNNDAHPAQVLVSAMNAFDGKTTKLGEVSGVIPELFGG